VPSAVRLFVRSFERWPWQILIGAWLGTLTFGFWAWHVQNESQGLVRSGWDTLYAALGLFTMNVSATAYPMVWQLNVVRFVAPLVAAFTAVTAVGLLVSREFFRLRQRFARDHIVVCGLGQRGLRLATELQARGHRVVVIERDQANPLLKSCKEAEVATVVADATEHHVLRLARVDSASHVVAVCGQDGVNAEIAAETAVLTRDYRPSSPHCLVHIMDTQLWRLLRERELGGDPTTGFHLEFFNVYESGARALVREHPAFSAGEQSPHVVIVGLGRLGEHVATRVAWEWHRHRRDGAPAMRLCLVDEAADRLCRTLVARQPQLSEVCDLVPVALDVRAPAFDRCEFLMDATDGECCATAVYVCIDDETRALSAALTIHRRTRGCRVPIVVRLDGGRGLAELLGGPTGDTAEFADIHSFSLLDAACQAEVVLEGTHETLARATHELWLDEQEKAGRGPSDNPIIVPWDQLPADTKESNRRAADHIKVMLAAAGYAPAPLEDWDADLFEFPHDELEMMAALEHQRWVDERAAAGWKYSPGPRDTKAKTSPYMVPWDRMPDDVAEYDRATVRKIPALLAEVGLQVRRRDGDARR
jgi:hypothetical protein